MSKKIQAVFFDIDGTLVSFQTHQVPPSTIRAIGELQKRGIKTFIATGRAFSQINNLGTLTFDGYITVNGGYCLTDKHEVMYKNSIHPADIHSLVRYHREEKPFPCLFVTHNKVFMSYSDHKVEEIAKLINLPATPIRPLEEAVDEEIFQIVAFFGENEEETIMKEVLHNCDSTRWNPLFTDIIARGNSKQQGIDQVLAYHNMDLANTISFGDGGNDISMLSHTPISFAMGNATDEVKKYATHITDSVDDNGIWNALKGLEII